jgi:hypothetical protein
MSDVRMKCHIAGSKHQLAAGRPSSSPDKRPLPSLSSHLSSTLRAKKKINTMHVEWMNKPCSGQPEATACEQKRHFPNANLVLGG